MKRLLILIAALALAGCIGTQGVVKGERAQTVECTETMPDRPTMATEVMPSDSTVDAYVQAARSEILDRDGYEIELRTALAACIRPINRAGK